MGDEMHPPQRAVGALGAANELEAVLCGFPETARLVRARLRRYEWRELGRDDVTRLVRKWYGKSAEWRMAGKGTRRWLEPERA